MAESAAGAQLSGGRFDALRVKIRDEESVRTKRCIWHWASRRREPKMCWAFGSAERGSHILAKGHERTAQSRSGGHSDRGGRRAKRLSGGHHHGLPAGQRADLHRAFKLLLSVLLRPGKSARPWLANSKPSIAPKPRRPPPNRSTSSKPAPWGKKYPMIAESWRRNWQQIAPSPFTVIRRRCERSSTPPMPLSAAAQSVEEPRALSELRGSH